MSHSRLITVIAALAVSSVVLADIINVGPGDSIQDAIDAAMDGDEIIVAPGTYFETINFLGKAIVLRSSAGPDVTIIDAASLEDSAVKFVGGEGPDTQINGFTITGTA